MQIGVFHQENVRGIWQTTFALTNTIESQKFYQFEVGRLDMKFSTRICILFGLFVLLQLNVWAAKPNDDAKSLVMDKLTERLLKKVMSAVQEFYNETRTLYSCVPDKLSDSMKETFRGFFNCADTIEKKFEGGRISSKLHDKLYGVCLAKGKQQTELTMKSFDPEANMCPENQTEKTYRIDVIKLLKKALDVDVKKMPEKSNIIRKTVLFANGESNLHYEVDDNSREDKECKEEPEVHDINEEVFKVDSPCGNDTVKYEVTEQVEIGGGFFKRFRSSEEKEENKKEPVKKPDGELSANIYEMF